MVCARAKLSAIEKKLVKDSLPARARKAGTALHVSISKPRLKGEHV